MKKLFLAVVSIVVLVALTDKIAWSQASPLGPFGQTVPTQYPGAIPGGGFAMGERNPPNNSPATNSGGAVCTTVERNGETRVTSNGLALPGQGGH